MIQMIHDVNAWQFQAKYVPLRPIKYFYTNNQLIMLNKYETVFITTPVLSEQQIKEAVDKFKDTITANGGTIEHEEAWGLRKLAYPIQKKTTGFYHLLQFEAEGSLVDKLETAYRRDERVIRFLTFRLDKYAYEYTLKRRSKYAAKQEEK